MQGNKRCAISASAFIATRNQRPGPPVPLNYKYSVDLLNFNTMFLFGLAMSPKSLINEPSTRAVVADACA